MEAFVDVRTAGGLAYRVQAPLAQFRLEQMDRFEMGLRACGARWEAAVGLKEPRNFGSERARPGSRTSKYQTNCL